MDALATNTRIIRKRRLMSYFMLTIAIAMCVTPAVAHGTQQTSGWTERRSGGVTNAQVQAVGNQQPRLRKSFSINARSSFEHNARLLNSAGTTVRQSGWIRTSNSMTSAITVGWHTIATHTAQNSGTTWRARAEARELTGARTTNRTSANMVMPNMR